jgi:hypothetical protein
MGDEKSSIGLIPTVRREMTERGLSAREYVPIAAIAYSPGEEEDAWNRFVEPSARVAMIGDIAEGFDLARLSTRIPSVLYVTRDEDLHALRAHADSVGANMVIASLIHDLSAKYVELLGDLAPLGRTICIVDDVDKVHEIKALLIAVPMLVRDIDSADLLVPQRAAARLRNCAAAFVPSRDFALEHRKSFIEAFRLARVAALYERDIYVRDGGLLSYEAESGASRTGMYDAVAALIRGIPARRLADVRAHRFRLSLNAFAAAELGRPLPASLIRRVDQWR